MSHVIILNKIKVVVKKGILNLLQKRDNFLLACFYNSEGSDLAKMQYCCIFANYVYFHKRGLARIIA